MKNCKYCGKLTKENYCCKLHEIYDKNKLQDEISKEIEKLSIEDIMQCFSDECITNIKTPECIQLINILIKKDKIDLLLENDETVEILFPDEIVHLLKTLPEKYVTGFLQKIDKILNTEAITTIMRVHKENKNSSQNDTAVDSFFVAKTLEC